MVTRVRGAKKKCCSYLRRWGLLPLSGYGEVNLLCQKEVKPLYLRSSVFSSHFTGIVSAEWILLCSGFTSGRSKP